MLAEHQPAYVLHTRPYRDTSLLVDFFTPEFGRFSAVVRGVRSGKAPKRNLLNPFSRLLISFQGKSSLKLVTGFEVETPNVHLVEKYLYSGFYLNELLVRLLPEMDAHTDIFLLYQQSLQALHEQQALEPVLRNFELCLLASLGYGIDFELDVKNEVPIQEEFFYCLDAQLGFFHADESVPANSKINGQMILAIANKDYQHPDVCKVAKYITRLLLKPLLGSKPLMSRALFV